MKLREGTALETEGDGAAREGDSEAGEHDRGDRNCLFPGQSVRDFGHWECQGCGRGTGRRRVRPMRSDPGLTSGLDEKRHALRVQHQAHIP